VTSPLDDLIDGALASNLVQARMGGRVERCHTFAHHGSYSNAAHSWGVAMLMWYLWPEDFQRLAIYCLTHDVPEAWTGDQPAPVGRYVHGFREQMGSLEKRLSYRIGLPSEHDLDQEDYAKLKACDALDFWMWCKEQERLGNQNAIGPRREVERYFSETSLPPRAQALYRQMAIAMPIPQQTGVIKEMMG
jgi:hypothetical protein